MLENRSFDHLFGFFPPPAGETIETCWRCIPRSSTCWNPRCPNPPITQRFEASWPAPFAVNDKEGPVAKLEAAELKEGNAWLGMI
jgi:phospholipase C